MVIAEFRRAGDTRIHEYDKAEFRLNSSAGGQTNLGNVFHEYCQMPRGERKARLRGLVQGFLTAMDDLPDSFDDVRSNLRPKVWTRATFAGLELRERLEGKKQNDIPLYPLGSHLVTTVVYDTPVAMRSISADDLGKWSVSYYEAMEIACENLAESSIAFSRIGDGFHSAMSGDSYDSARILLRDQVLSWEVKGEHVAMIPQRDAMYVTGSEDNVGLDIMLSLAEATIRDEARPLVPIPIRFVDGEWEDWMVPRSHELFRKFHELETNYLASIYAEQKEQLVAIHDKEEIDVFVASFSGIQMDSGEVISYCVWTEGIESLLPKTDLIMIGNADESAAYEWNKVAEVVRLEPVDDLYPSRHRVGQTPTPEQLGKIGAVEL